MAIQLQNTGVAIIVEPDNQALAALVDVVRACGFPEIRAFSKPSEVLALAALDDEVALVVCEVDCDGESCLDLLRMARARCPGVVCLAGSATAGRAAIAAAMLEGADGFLDRPVTAESLAGAIGRHRDAGDECHRLARRMVGRISMRDAQQALRTTMLNEALRRTAGSRRATAGLLGIDRRCVQRMIQDLEHAAGAV